MDGWTRFIKHVEAAIYNGVFWFIDKWWFPFIKMITATAVMKLQMLVFTLRNSLLAGVINIFILAMDQMSLCNVKKRSL